MIDVENSQKQRQEFAQLQTEGETKQNQVENEKKKMDIENN